MTFPMLFLRASSLPGCKSPSAVGLTLMRIRVIECMYFYVPLCIRVIERMRFYVLLRIRVIECMHFYVLLCYRMYAFLRAPTHPGELPGELPEKLPGELHEGFLVSFLESFLKYFQRNHCLGSRAGVMSLLHAYV